MECKVLSLEGEGSVCYLRLWIHSLAPSSSTRRVISRTKEAVISKMDSLLSVALTEEPLSWDSLERLTMINFLVNDLSSVV